MSGQFCVRSFFPRPNKRFGFKDLLLGRLAIPSLDEEFNSLSDRGKEKARTIELNEITYTELILLIDVKTSSGKTDFNIIKSCKTKDHPDGNAATAWGKLKNKYVLESLFTL
jgi:hypothetical protein